MLIDDVESYLAVRRAVGFKLIDTGEILRRFARFATERGETHVVARTAVEWAGMAASQTRRHKRLRVIVLFARYIRAEDGEHELPPDGMFPCRRTRPTPYIFSREEIRVLVREAANRYRGDSFQPLACSTCIALLATTGLRVSEALFLRIADLVPDGLVIRETKFRKSRLVPLHDSAREALTHYLERRRRVAGNEDHLFVNRHGRRLRYVTLAAAFSRAKQATGISGVPGGPKPRLHCLRHTFAVRALEACPDGRDAIRRHMVALSTYLGHVKIDCTYWYLESTPQLMADIAGACELAIGGGAS